MWRCQAAAARCSCCPCYSSVPQPLHSHHGTRNWGAWSVVPKDNWIPMEMTLDWSCNIPPGRLLCTCIHALPVIRKNSASSLSLLHWELAEAVLSMNTNSCMQADNPHRTCKFHLRTFLHPLTFFQSLFLKQSTTAFSSQKSYGQWMQTHQHTQMNPNQKALIFVSVCDTCSGLLFTVKHLTPLLSAFFYTMCVI